MPELPARAGNKAGASDHEDLANPFGPQSVAEKFGGALPQQLRAFRYCASDREVQEDLGCSLAARGANPAAQHHQQALILLPGGPPAPFMDLAPCGAHLTKPRDRATHLSS